MDLLQILQTEKEVKGDKIFEVELTDSELENLVSNNILIEREDETYELNIEKIKGKTRFDFAWSLYEYYFKEKNPNLALEAINTYVQLCKKENRNIDYAKVFVSKIKVSNLNVPFKQVKREKMLTASIKELLFSPSSSDNIAKLEPLVEEFCKLNQGRNFYADYYQGELYFKKKQYNKAANKFTEIVDKDPDNYIVWSRLITVYKILNRRNELNQAIRQLHRLNEKKSPFLSIEMAKINFKEGNYAALKTQMNSVYEDTDPRKIQVFENVRNYIKNQLNNLYDDFGYTNKTKKEYEQIKEILDDIEEKMNILLIEKSLSNVETNFNTEENTNSDAYQALYDAKQDMMVPTKLLNHIKNLEIVAEEDYLLCLSAAKVLFEHNMPNYAEKYLKFVATSKNKTDAVKKALDQTVKNKKLYLNR